MRVCQTGMSFPLQIASSSFLVEDVAFAPNKTLLARGIARARSEVLGGRDDIVAECFQRLFALSYLLYFLCWNLQLKACYEWIYQAFFENGSHTGR